MDGQGLDEGQRVVRWEGRIKIDLGIDFRCKSSKESFKENSKSDFNIANQKATYGHLKQNKSIKTVTMEKNTNILNYANPIHVKSVVTHTGHCTELEASK